MYASEEASPRAGYVVRPILVPVGSLEGHGPDLPLGTDAMVAQRLVAAVADRTGALVLPLVGVGDSHEHSARPGTVSVSAESLHTYIQDLVGSLEGQIFVINGHGGNKQAVEGLQGVTVLHTWHLVDRDLVNSMRDSSPGGCCHAGEFEGSLAAFLFGSDPSTVVVEPAPPQWDTFTTGPRPHGGLNLARSNTGVMGDPRHATFAKGEAWFSSMVEGLCAQVPAQDLIEEGVALVGPELEPVEGAVVVRDGVIKSIEEGPVAGDRRNRIIIPSMVNAHVHLGDSAFLDIGQSVPLQELVAPPNGLKHRLLAQTPPGMLASAMRQTTWEMVRMGIGVASDFREGGLVGVRLAREAIAYAPLDMILLGRADNPEELASVVMEADGLGAASPSSLDADMVSAAHRAHKPVAAHVLEAPRPEQLDNALELGVDIAVHMTHALPKHATCAANAVMSVIVCPRSNLTLTDRLPPVRDLLDAGLQVGLGTDNSFVSSPNLFREMELLARGCRLTDREALHMATVSGGKVLGRDVSISPGNRCSFLVMEHARATRTTRDLIRCIVRRFGPDNIVRRYLGHHVIGDVWFPRGH
ncbi:MAG: creatininase family protein [Candidatus Undinarchaeales archaeon]|nr:creatininase family protein [Candidatus Undinarchaeales archaeon]MDP7492500.1 creatininase family protein [Candidatus Undinarchaeales archaeon]